MINMKGCCSDVYSCGPGISSPQATTKDNKGKEAERGRTIGRRPRVPYPLDRTESLKRMQVPAMEIDVRSIRTRFHRSRLANGDPFAQFKPLPEPHSLDPIRNSVSERVEGPVEKSKVEVDTSGRTLGFLRKGSNSFHNLSTVQKASTSTRTTSSLDYERHPSDNNLQASLDIKSSTNITKSPMVLGPQLCSVAELPAEIMHQIYFELHPVDFNSARHTCRSWFMNSLERSILQTMLIRGGWSNHIIQETFSAHLHDSQTRANVKWLMSKSIALECALGPDWSGNGHCIEEKSPRYESHKDKLSGTPFVQTSIIDFSKIGVHYPGWDQSPSGIVVIVSTCGRFLMVVRGCLVFIYELDRSDAVEDSAEPKKAGSLRLVTRIVCPNRVVTCSMDTSLHRHAIAVLLDGRVGLVYDLAYLQDRSRYLSDPRCSAMQNPDPSNKNEYRNQISISSLRIRYLDQTRPEQPSVYPVIAAGASQSRLPTDPGYVGWHEWSHSDATTQPDVMQPTLLLDIFGHSATSVISSPMLAEPSAVTLYATLCSTDDLPRSIALCPQRQCVAFGCTAGIELHWIDALTGQDLIRWFPLIAPSDYLYFLPLRAGVDNAKKVRLISSAAAPSEQSAMADRFGRSGASSRGSDGGKASPFWCVLPIRHGHRRWGVGATNVASPEILDIDKTDHYHAVPLSDGYHILFTDPVTGLLCLGSVAPVRGRRKLLRKIWFASPPRQGSPVAYTAGSDLSHGVRVVAAYGNETEQSVWFFSIPIDVFTKDPLEGETNNFLPTETKPQAKFGGSEWMKWWRNFEFEGKDKIWPVEVKGRQIGTCQGLVDLSVDAGPKMTIWAFSRDGIVKTWQIHSRDLDGKIGRKHLVVRDGTFREVDPNGDVQMHDAPSLADRSFMSFRTQDQDTFDETMSIANSGIWGNQHAWGRQVSFGWNPEDCDTDGDMLMTDLPGSDERIPEYVQAHSLKAALENFDGQRVTLNSYHSNSVDPLHAEQLRINRGDIIDVLTGITRIDIEIW